MAASNKAQIQCDRITPVHAFAPQTHCMQQGIAGTFLKMLSEKMDAISRDDIKLWNVLEPHRCGETKRGADCIVRFQLILFKALCFLSKMCYRTVGWENIENNNC